MSINIDDFDLLKIRNGKHGVKESEIIVFLLKNKDKAFTNGEISKAINNKNVFCALSKMEKDGVLEHRSPYWRLRQELLALKDKSKLEGENPNV